jgi:hypothetical protein
MSVAKTVVCLNGVGMPGAVMTLGKRRLESEYDYDAKTMTHTCSAIHP